MCKKSEVVRSPREEPTNATVAFDFAYTSTSTSQSRSLVTLVACDSRSKSLRAVPVERRGRASSLSSKSRHHSWTSGVLIGKTESGVWLSFQKDGIHAARSARSIGETYDPKAIANVKIYSWQVKPTALASRVLPHKITDKPALLLPAVVDKEEQKKLQNEVNDETASDLPSEEEDNDWEKILEQETDQVLAELEGDNQENKNSKSMKM